MTWNYRIVRYRDDKGYGLHEVYYSKEGLPNGMTTDPISFTCGSEEGPEGVVNSLTMALKDATTREVFDEPLEWPQGEKAEIIRILKEG